MTRKAEEKSKEPLSPTAKKKLEVLKKQKADKKIKQNLTQDYSYTGIPGAKATATGVKYNKGGKRANFRGGGRTNLLEELGRVEGESSNRNRRAEVSRIHGELNKGYSLGGRVGAAKRGFNKKILRKD
jgi:hypothetical protein